MNQPQLNPEQTQKQLDQAQKQIEELKGIMNQAGGSPSTPQKPLSSMMVQTDDSIAPTTDLHPFTTTSTIGQLKECMDGNAFMILLDLYNWAQKWDAMNEGQLEWDDSVMRMMFYPFIGFGNNPRLWAVVAEKVHTAVSIFAPMWMRDPVYRSANKMAWLMLSHVATILSAQSMGHDGQNRAIDILSKGFVEK